MNRIKYLTVIILLSLSVYGFCEEEPLANIDIENNNEQETHVTYTGKIKSNNSYSFIGFSFNFSRMYLPADAGLQFIYCPKGSFGISAGLSMHMMGESVIGLSLMPVYKYKRLFMGVGFHTYYYYGNERKKSHFIETALIPDSWERFLPSVEVTIGTIFGKKFQIGIGVNFRHLLLKNRKLNVFNLIVLIGF